jgi:hypothetical protein
MLLDGRRPPSPLMRSLGDDADEAALPHLAEPIQSTTGMKGSPQVDPAVPFVPLWQAAEGGRCAPGAKEVVE